MATRRFEDLSTTQQRTLIGAIVVTSVWQLAMLWDLWRRPAELIRGSKRRWVIASFLRPFGQIAYYGWGRCVPRPEGWFDDVAPDDLAG